jgi:hypothetical protein
MKILRAFLGLFKFESKKTRFRDEFIPFLPIVLVLTIIFGLIYIFDRNNRYGTGIFAGILFAAFVFQCYALAGRLLCVYDRKKDLRIINDMNHIFKYESISVDYKYINRILRSSMVGVKMYFKDKNYNNHLLEMEIYYRNKYDVKRMYYYDLYEIGYDRLFNKLSEDGIINNSRLLLAGTNLIKIDNREFLELWLKKACKKNT